MTTTTTTMSSKIVIVLFVSLLLCETAVSAHVIRGCDPHHSSKNCPDGYCCVRDEFLPSETFCRRIGIAGDNCTTRPSESECPCEEGLMCHANIQSSHFTSLYGTCVNATVTEVSIVGR